MKPFSALPLDPSLLAVVEELGFSEMTPIQEQSLPLLLNGEDLIGQANTGSGKTAAFTLPIVQRLDLGFREIQAIVLCPTRELSAQVAREMRRLGRRHKGLQVVVLAGGEQSRPQREALERGVHVVVGTPGRILDHLLRGRLNLAHLSCLVLDEADRMLDMGFEPDVHKIIQMTPPTRQTVFFSATYPPTIQQLSRKYQSKPQHVRIEDNGDEASIEHLYFDADSAEQKPRLLSRVIQSTDGPILVFCNFKASVSEILERLEHEGVSAAGLHGDLEQRDRDRVLAMFRNGSRRVLVATDVAARGLDIEGLETVVHYETPHEASIFTHRSGRTGRAGKTGLSIAIANMSERARLRKMGFTLQKGEFKKLRSEGAESSIAMQTLYVSGGRKEKVRPGDIVGALTGGALKSDTIGKIEIHDKFAYVAVQKCLADKAIQTLKNDGIKGRKFLVRAVD